MDPHPLQGSKLFPNGPTVGVDTTEVYQRRGAALHQTLGNIEGVARGTSAGAVGDADITGV